MSKIKDAFSKLINQLKRSGKRFPETIFVAVCMVIIGIMTNHDLPKIQDTLEQLLMTFALGLPLFSAAKLVIERKSLSRYYRIGSDVLFAGLLIGFYFIIPWPVDQRFMMRYLISMAILYMIFLLIPYVYRRKYFASYCLKLVSSFLITYLYTLVLYLGLISIIFTVDKLFSLNIDSEVYVDLLFIAVGIFGITYFLGKLPRIEDEMRVEAFPIVLKVLIVSIIMPLITTYTLVLYAYFAKILIEWKWPEGLVGQLVVWYGLISVIILFSIQDLGESSPWIRTYKRFFPIAFLLPLVMMFVAIGMRISQNGWTLPRYYVVLVGIWLLIMAGYYIIKMKTHSTFPVVLAIVLLLISIVGPLDSYSTSIRSQSNRLELLLEESHILVGGEVVAREDVSVDKKAKISNIVSYLDNLESLEEVYYLPEDFDLSQMKKVFGFEAEYAYYPSEEKERYFGYYFQPMNTISPVAGYNYMIDFAVYEGSEVKIEDTTIIFSASIEDDRIEIMFNKKTLAIHSIQEIAQILYGKLGNRQDLHEGDLSYTIENDKAIVVLNLTNLYGNNSGDVFQVTSMEGTAWVMLK